MGKRNWKEFDYRYGVVTSTSAVELFKRCNRLWWMQKVLRLPEAPFSAGRRGDALHALCEVWLLGNDAPEAARDWREGLDDVDQDMLGRAFRQMVKDGTIERTPGIQVEKKIQVDVLDGRRVSMTGFVDAYVPAGGGGRLSVQDHKTSSSERWFTKETDLANDTAMLIYAYALLGDAVDVELRHNQVVVDPLTPTSKITRVVVTREHVVNHWNRIVIPVATEMLRLKTAKIDENDWATVAGPADTRKSCYAYNRPCSMYDICHRGLSPSDARLRGGVTL